MATDCEVCTGVARGGRIRVIESSSALLVRLLNLERHDALFARRMFIDSGNTAGAGEANQRLREIDVLLAEIERTQRELGWLTTAT